MEHYLDFMNPAEQEDEIPETELEIAQSKAHKEMLKRMDLTLKISTATAKLKFLEDYFSTGYNVFALGKIQEIINDLNK